MTEEMRTYSARLQMMYNYFKLHAAKDPLSIPEFNAAAQISKLIYLKDNYSNDEILEIRAILEEVDSTKHKNDSHWYDYKLHINYYLGLFGY